MFLSLDEVHIEIVRQNNFLSGFERRQSSVWATAASKRISKGTGTASRAYSRVFEHSEGETRLWFLLLFSASATAILACLLVRTHLAIVDEDRFGEIGFAEQRSLVNEVFVSGRLRAPRVRSWLLLELDRMLGASRIIRLHHTYLKGATEGR